MQITPRVKKKKGFERERQLMRKKQKTIEKISIYLLESTDNVKHGLLFESIKAIIPIPKIVRKANK